MQLNRFALAHATALAISACTTVRNDIHAYNGNVPDLSDKDVAAFVATKDDVIDRLKALSGTDPRIDGDDWRPVVEPGSFTRTSAATAI